MVGAALVSLNVGPWSYVWRQIFKVVSAFSCYNILASLFFSEVTMNLRIAASRCHCSCASNMNVQGSIGKFPDCYCCNCLGERRWEGRQRSHFRKPIASVCCHMTPGCEHPFFLNECFFDFVFCFVHNGWWNWAMCLPQVLREAR
jgi:hypothetical protein